MIPVDVALLYAGVLLTLTLHHNRVSIRAVIVFPRRYKYSAYETAKQSSLGISSFSDDANAAAKVGGLDALKKAAVAAKKGATASQLKAKALQAEKAALKAAENEEKKDVLPSYLLPLPEDTPRKYGTWKNY